MTLNQLSEQNMGLVGSTVGFVIKSLAHPERKFKVEAKLGNGKYAITRIDTGANYFVLGTENRYEMAFTAARIREVQLEIDELEAEAGAIAARLTELRGEVVGFGGTIAG